MQLAELKVFFFQLMFILLTNKAFFYGFNFSNNHKN